jgi:prevent-host-death family protein
MLKFPSTDLKQSLGDVFAAAAQSPVAITRHNKPRFVLMAIEAYERHLAADPRRTQALADAPQDEIDLLLTDIDRQLDKLDRD